MKKLLVSGFFLIGLVIPVCLKAQLNHFFYFQTENKQPFYAKLDKKIYSSSVSGYLIIPKLTDGIYSIAIGFPKSEIEEQLYSCTVSSKDEGYLIKNFGEKGWGLFNLQSLDLTMDEKNKSGKDLKVIEKNDAFSAMLSDAVNDPSIKQTEKVKQTIKPVINKTVNSEPAVENTIKINSNEIKDSLFVEVKPNQIVDVKVVKKNVLTGSEGYEMVFIDKSGKQPDTINVFIPFEKVQVNNQTDSLISAKTGNDLKLEQSSSNENISNDLGFSVKTDSVNVENKEVVKKESKVDSQIAEKNTDIKFLSIELPSPNKKVSSPVEKNEEVPINQISTDSIVLAPNPMINSDCKSYATEEDFLKLRKKMAAEEVDDEMISIAKKYFKTKCFTTNQIKNLSVLFLKDIGKYNFFDLAYQYVSDSHNFSILENQLSDNYYKSRFKSMIRH